MILNESTSYPKIFTHDPLDLPPWTQEVTELKLDNAAHFLMLRMYLGWLARTGAPATHDDGLWFLQLLLKNPRILVMWTQLRAIAEPEGLMAVTAAGFGLMAEHHGKDVMDDAGSCRCSCHWLHEHTEAAAFHVHGTEIPRRLTAPHVDNCTCYRTALEPDSFFQDHSGHICTMRYNIHFVAKAAAPPKKYEELHEDKCSYECMQLCFSEFGFTARRFDAPAT